MSDDPYTPDGQRLAPNPHNAPLHAGPFACLACRLVLPTPEGFEVPVVCSRCGVQMKVTADGTTVWRIRPGSAEAAIRSHAEPDTGGDR